jgi:negative regulator of sigma E activity
VSDERHDEIAARLRDEAGAQAPERLRADVMLRVRAEPRPRRIRPRRRPWSSLGTIAAAACVLAALVFGLSHVNLAGGGSAASGGGSAAASAGAELHSAGAVGGGATRTARPATAPGAAQATGSDAGRVLRKVRAHKALDRALAQFAMPLALSNATRSAYLPAPLARALRSLELDRHARGGH